MRVFRPVAEADLRILIGSVLPHLQAGFGGGYKLIFPGTSHRTTLGALHRQGLEGRSDAAGLLGGDAADNPMRRAIHAAAGRLGPCWSISHLIGGPGQVFRIVAGHPERVQDLLGSRGAATVPGAAGRAGGSGRGGQSSLAGRPHAELQGVASPPRCLPAWRRARRPVLDRPRGDRSLVPDRGAAADRRDGRSGRLGDPPAVADRPADRLRRSGSPAAFMLRWARELVVDRTVLVYAPPLRERIGPRLGPVRLFDDQAALWQAAAVALESRDRPDRGPPSSASSLKAGLTYVPRSTGRR